MRIRSGISNPTRVGFESCGSQSAICPPLVDRLQQDTLKKRSPLLTQERLANLHLRLNSSMTTSEPSRLDRIERILDTLATNQVNERDRRLELREDLELLHQRQQQSQQQIDQLTADIGNLAIQVEEISTQAEQDRSQAAIDRAEFRSTVQGILDVLRQQHNGNGGQRQG